MSQTCPWLCFLWVSRERRTGIHPDSWVPLSSKVTHQHKGTQALMQPPERGDPLHLFQLCLRVQMEFPKHQGELGAKIRAPRSSLSSITNQTEKYCHGDTPPRKSVKYTIIFAVNIPTDPKLTSSFSREGSYPQNLLPHKFLELFKCFLLSLLISLPLVQLSSSHSPCRVRGNLWPSSSHVCHPLDSQQIQQTGCAGAQLFGTDTLQPPSNRWGILLFHRYIPQHSSSLHNNLIMFRGRCSKSAALYEREQHWGGGMERGWEKLKHFAKGHISNNLI